MKIKPEKLREIFIYDPVAGEVYWKIPRGQKVKAGQRAGSFDKEGYRQISLTLAGVKRVLREHHVIWCLVYGYWPVGELDHKDRNRGNNKLKNLRKATRVQNNHNRAPTKKWKGIAKKWEGIRIAGYITVNKKTIHLGFFKSRKRSGYCI